MMSEEIQLLAAQTIAPEIARRALEDLIESGALATTGASDEFLPNLANLAIISPPMLDSLRRHPEWLGWLRSRIEAGPVPDSGIGPGAPPGPDLHGFKRQQYLEIAYRDVAGLDLLEDTVRKLSDLADLIVEAALASCLRELLPEAPASVRSLHPGRGFAVIALGKLGARELNYSSDIDLVFCRRTCDDKDELRFFTRLGERLARTLAQTGPEGFLYRVDLRLRPYGETGPLVPTIDSLMSYYESWGEAWERQTLIKARHVAGDAELGGRFTAFAERFVFARPMDETSLEEIKRVKHRSEKEYARRGAGIHVKQGPGGIRDIEFYVQFHQLVAGPKHAAARAAATLDALSALEDARVLLQGELPRLSLAYRFLRILEHRLQLRALTPQAVVPEAAPDAGLLARGIGFDDAGKLRLVLDANRARVREIIERVYLTPGFLRLREREEEFARLLTDRIPKERVRELLANYGFIDTDKAWQNIRLLAVGPDGNILPPAERRAFLEFVFPLLEVMRESFDPDQALHKLESFAAATGNRVSFLRTLASRRPHLKRLSNLLALSNRAHHILVRHPEYFDSLARGIHLHEGRSSDEMYLELSQRFGASPRPDDRELVLRRHRQRELIRVAYRDLAGLADALEVSGELSGLAEACCRAALELTGPPRSVFEADAAAGLTVVALGKLGSRQMHYGSDLDLIFIYDDPPPGMQAAERAALQRAMDSHIERFLEFIAGVTREGTAYAVDLRLRPEGSAGLLARSWSSFLDHAARFMQPWERMALVRSRVLFGTERQSRRWSGLLEDAVYRFDWTDDAVEAVRHIKRRIETEKNRESRTHADFKFGRGGITDLEFLVQFLQVRNGRAFEPVRAPAVADAVPALARAGALSDGESAGLLEAHRFQRLVENRYQLMEEWAGREVSRESPALTRLARSIGRRGREELLSEWNDHAGFVRAVFERRFLGS